LLPRDRLRCLTFICNACNSNPNALRPSLVFLRRLLANVPGMVNISALRTIRVLRPLRSLVILPGMKLLVTSLLRSIPALLSVMVLMMFVFAIFGILGIQLWVGLFHARCRITAAPIALVDGGGPGIPGAGVCSSPTSDACLALIMNATAVALYSSNPSLTPSTSINGTLMAATLNSSVVMPCLPGTLISDESQIDMQDSPWETPQDCFWPLLASDTSLCTMNDNGGSHECLDASWCGSDYDFFGHPRFISEVAIT
jgi:hypothetical protein